MFDPYNPAVNWTWTIALVVLCVGVLCVLANEWRTR